MPVGTAGAVKAVTARDLQRGRRPDHPRPTPTTSCCARATRWWPSSAGCTASRAGSGPILTDSGGYQVFSLAALRKLTEEGVVVPQPPRRHAHLLTPERSMEIQHEPGRRHRRWRSTSARPGRAPRRGAWRRRSRAHHALGRAQPRRLTRRARRTAMLRHRAGRRPPRPARAQRRGHASRSASPATRSAGSSVGEPKADMMRVLDARAASAARRTGRAT